MRTTPHNVTMIYQNKLINLTLTSFSRSQRSNQGSNWSNYYIGHGTAPTRCSLVMNNLNYVISYYLICFFFHFKNYPNLESQHEMVKWGKYVSICKDWYICVWYDVYFYQRSDKCGNTGTPFNGKFLCR